MNQNQNTPELRFDGFTEPWKQRELGQLFDYEQPGPYIVKSTEYNNFYPTPVLTAGKTFILGYADESFGVKSASPDNPVIIFDDFTTASHYVDFPFKVKSSAIKLLTLKNSDDDITVASNALQMLAYIPVGHERHWISEFAGFNVFIPDSSVEQQFIGTFFRNLDSLIALQQRKYERLQHLKQALLRKMFPKPGEQVPELRFDGFTEPWEERKLGELYVRAGSGGTPSSGDPRYYGGHIPFLGIADMDGRFITKTEKSLTDDGLSNSAAWIVPAGSISLAMYASVGKVGITCCDMATSQAFYNMVFDSTVTRDFVYSRLDRADCLSEWRSLISTGTQSNLNAQKVRDWAVAMPSLPEQHAIGSLFRELDDFITLQQRKYERLQHLKQALLRKMFV